jgi:hypothetical protein
MPTVIQSPPPPIIPVMAPIMPNMKSSATGDEDGIVHAMLPG